MYQQHYDTDKQWHAHLCHAHSNM